MDLYRYCDGHGGRRRRGHIRLHAGTGAERAQAYRQQLWRQIAAAVDTAVIRNKLLERHPGPNVPVVQIRVQHDQRE